MGGLDVVAAENYAGVTAFAELPDIGVVFEVEHVGFEF